MAEQEILAILYAEGRVAYRIVDGQIQILDPYEEGEGIECIRFV